MRLSCVELASITAPMNVPIAPRIPVASPNQIIPLVPVGNRRVLGPVHVEFHRFGPTVAAMTGVMNRVVSNNTNELKASAAGRFRLEVSTLGLPIETRILGVLSKNTNELKTGAPGRRRVSSIIMMESATIKGLATCLCFWTRRVRCANPTVGQAAVVRPGSPAAHTDLMGVSAIKYW